MKQFLHKKIPAALMALCLLLALCCQTLAAGRTLVPGGYTVGIKLYAEGLMVTEVEPDAPAQRAGLRRGDVILTAGGKKTASAQALLDSIQSAEPIVVRVERGGHEAEFLVTPEKTASGYRLGILVRDHIAGIGTVTYYDPVSLTGTRGTPGELHGIFDVTDAVGTVEKNTACGIFGTLSQPKPGEAVQTAPASAVTTGAAEILSNVDGEQVQRFSAAGEDRRHRTGHERQPDPAEREAGGRGDARAGERPDDGVWRTDREYAGNGKIISARGQRPLAFFAWM